MTDLTPEQQFHIEEFKALKTEIITKLSDQKTLQRNVIISLSVLYSVAATLDKYQVTSTVKPITWIIWWLPLGLVILGFASSYADDWIIARAGEYIKKLEHDALWEGWETYLGSKVATENSIWIHLPKAFWVTAAALTFYVARLET